jgi:hypothetical protein
MSTVPAAATDHAHVRKANQIEAGYTAHEVEFMLAMDAFKRSRGRPFPTWQEVLQVLTTQLGYKKVLPPGTAALEAA